jgi:hypothetical protein
MKTFLVYFACLVSVVFANSSGSPICVDDASAMEGGMGKVPTEFAKTKATWSASSLNYTVGQNISLRMRSDAIPRSFKGLLLFAQTENKTHVGKWTAPPGFKHLDDQCKDKGGAGSTLSHDGEALKNSTMIFTWVAPDKPQGPVEIRGIVVFGEQDQWLVFDPLKIDGPKAEAKSDKDAKSSNDGNKLMLQSVLFALVFSIAIKLW